MPSFQPRSLGIAKEGIATVKISSWVKNPLPPIRKILDRERYERDEREGEAEVATRKLKPKRPSDRKPDHSPGIYLIRERGRDKEPVYIGETNDLATRKGTHFGINGKYSAKSHVFIWQRADKRSTSNSRKKIERALIKIYKPRDNKNIGGGGRHAARKRR